MIERHVTFHVLTTQENEFARFFEKEYRPAMAKTEGFVKAELLQDTENAQDFMMILRFESLDAAEAWRASALHQELKPHLKALYNGSDLQVLKIVTQE